MIITTNERLGIIGPFDAVHLLFLLILTFIIFSSPEYKVLMVSY